MALVVTLSIIFIIAFGLIFLFFFKENQKHKDKDHLFLVIGGAFLFALVFLVAFALIIFTLFGATSIINHVFSLQITSNQLMIFTIAAFIYLYTVDNVCEVLTEYMIGNNIAGVFFLALTRIVGLFFIGHFLRMSKNTSLALAIGVALIVLTIEWLDHVREKHKAQTHSSDESS
ncbi:hypothetical protein G4V62_07490 [Bacillaceae bacterium SIJ1]|uniref:hypothetical protein n=1 Tax=Litoribacterium kuwaitense TaxID=1398745 RepID=UPI0013EDE920|nr:hypothetical protein [Litoribacterium kuwaitense]NGP44808.1 hypothetical protein [Litoribacterium kuwaitense]